MSKLFLLVLFVIGVVLMTVGAVLIYWPSAFVLVGAVCAAVAVRVPVGDR